MFYYKMKILVLGYYDHNNLGDDMFKDSFKKLLPKCDLTFVDIMTLYEQINFEEYDRIICGGGDIINDYFLNKIKYISENFDKPIYACSVGIPYRDLIQRNYLQYYDHIFTRNKSYLLDIQQVMGSQYTHYLPDIVMNNYKIKDEKIDLSDRKIVGIFLASSLIDVFPCLIEIFKYILENSDYILHFLCFDTSDNLHDNKINRKIIHRLGDYKNRIINDSSRYTPDDMFELISSFKFCICNRFHSNILSTLAGIPFIGLHYANKSLLYYLENNYTHYCAIDINEIARPTKIDIDNFISIYNNFLPKLNDIRYQLINIAKKNQQLLSNGVMYQIIKNSDKRHIKANIHFIDRVEEIYQKYDKSVTDLSVESTAKNILYDITRETSSDYSYGMIDNLKRNPEKLREMIDWIWKDKREKILSIPNVNLNSTSNHCFNGIHRSGWKFALNSIQALHSPYSPILDVYCDATFGWCRENPCKEFGIIPYTQLWCGIFHHTPNKMYTNNNIDDATNTQEFIDSLPTCIGLFTLSEWLSEWLRNKLKKYGYNILVETLYHPTSLNIKQFNIGILNNDKIPIVNVGAWLRDSYSIYAVKFNDKFKKYRLKGKNMDNYFPPKEEIDLTPEVIKSGSLSVNNCNGSAFLYCLYKYLSVNKNINLDARINRNLTKMVKDDIESVKVIEYLNDKEYDELLSNNICFINLIECSAANTLIECIARSCPIIVNRIEPVIEYIGKDYPLLYDNIEELETLVTVEKIREAYHYLQNYELKKRISSEHFLDSLYNSKILQKTMIV